MKVILKIGYNEYLLVNGNTSMAVLKALNHAKVLKGTNKLIGGHFARQETGVEIELALEIVPDSAIIPFKKLKCLPEVAGQEDLNPSGDA